MPRTLTIFGDRPGPRTDPKRPLFPHTTTGAAANLIKLLGIEQTFYIANVERFNAMHDGENSLSVKEGRERVERIMTERMHADWRAQFIFLGIAALNCAPQVARHLNFCESKGMCLFIPHTSGMNRWYNDPLNVIMAREALAAFTDDWRREIVEEYSALLNSSDPGKS